jgi:hypothetical protein
LCFLFFITEAVNLCSLTASVWSWRTESNPRPADYKSAALPAELRQHFYIFSTHCALATRKGLAACFACLPPPPSASAHSPKKCAFSIFFTAHALSGSSPLDTQLDTYTALMCLLATRKGLEPSTSSVTGWHSNQLNYRAKN